VAEGPPRTVDLETDSAGLRGADSKTCAADSGRVSSAVRAAGGSRR